MIRNMRYANSLGLFDQARVAVLGFVGADGTPRSCAVTPYVIGGDLTVTSTLAYLAKVRAISRHPAVALYRDGAHASAAATVELHATPGWFDQHLRNEELRKYPPARTLLALPFHRRILWWYVGRAVVTLSDARIEDVDGSDQATITTLIDGRPQIRPLRSGSVDASEKVIDIGDGIPDGPAFVLLHDEDDDMAELRQVTIRGTVVDGRIHVERRSGSLEPSHPGTIAQLRSLRALSRAATANRSEIANWNPGVPHA